jgi:phosphate:Na+ symporter
MSLNEQGKRLAVAHLIFNLVTGLIAIALIHQLMSSVEWISAHVGIAEDDYTLKLAVFHTLFNIIGVLVMLPLIGRLVSLLEGMFKPKVLLISQPKYPNDATIEFPDTALEAIRLETLRIWDHTIDLLAEAFGFERGQICSDTDLAAVAQSQRRLPDFDVDAAYAQQVKPLYSAIITFLIRAGFPWKDEQSGDIHWLREANQNMVDAIKACKHLRKNLGTGAASTNEEQRKFYNTIRIQLSLLIRELEEIRSESIEESPVLSLDYLRLFMNELVEKFNAQLASAMTEGRLSGELAVSLLNDSNYAQKIYSKLVDMGETLFVRHNHNLNDAEHQVLLSEGELLELESDTRVTDSN